MLLRAITCPLGEVEESGGGPEDEGYLLAMNTSSGCTPAALVGKEEVTMMKYAKLFSLRKTPQSEPIAGTRGELGRGLCLPGR